MEYKYQCGGYEKGQWVCKGVFDTQQEALDLANYLNRHPNSEYYDWSRFPVVTEPDQGSTPRDRMAQEFLKTEPKQERNYSEEDMLDFGKYLLQLSNSAMSKRTNMKMLDLEVGKKLVKDLFEQFKKK